MLPFAIIWYCTNRGGEACHWFHLTINWKESTYFLKHKLFFFFCIFCSFVFCLFFPSPETSKIPLPNLKQTMFYWTPGKVFGCSFRRPYQHATYFSTRSKSSSFFLHSDLSSEVMDTRLNWVQFPFLSKMFKHTVCAAWLMTGSTVDLCSWCLFAFKA